METKESDNCMLRVENSRVVLSLLYLAKVYRLDLITLLFLFRKYGDEVLYFFYMFAGLRCVFPKPARLSKIFAVSEEMGKCLNTGKEFQSVRVQEKEVFSYISEYYNESENCLLIPLGVPPTRVSDEGLGGMELVSGDSKEFEDE